MDGGGLRLRTTTGQMLVGAGLYDHKPGTIAVARIQEKRQFR